MAIRYFIDSITNKIVGYSEDDELDTPEGQTAVLQSTIRASYATGPIVQGGTWISNVYTLPETYKIPVTSGNTVEHAIYESRVTIEQFREWRRDFHRLEPYYPAIVVQDGLDWLYYGELGFIKVMTSNSTDWDIERLILFAINTKYGDGNITTVAEYLDQAQDIGHINVPTSPVIWRDPNDENAAAVTITNAVTFSSNLAITNKWATTPTRQQIQSMSWLDNITSN